MSKLIVGNLKMNLTSEDEVDNYINNFKDAIGQNDNGIEIVVCPPFIWLEKFFTKLNQKNISLGAQNINENKKGSFTGEISASMVQSMGVKYVIVGHSERRKYFAENNAIINKKIKAVLQNNMMPILCVGETLAERKNEDTKQVISAQIISGLEKLSKKQISKCIIAYEPVWAIGSGKIPEMETIVEMRILIQKILAEKLEVRKFSEVKILYGGSVNYSNAEVCVNSGMSGVLVGGESLNPKKFIKIIKKLC